MRTLHIIVLIIAVLASLFILSGFARLQYWLWQMRDDKGLHLLAEPHIKVFQALTHEHGERDGWCPMGPEGSYRCVFSFPSWPLVLMAAGVAIYASRSLLDSSERAAA